MNFILTVLGLIFSTNAFAGPVATTDCEDYSISLNYVSSMRTFANGSIKVFEIDMIEPAAASAGVAIAIDRGAELSSFESFCRYVPGLSAVDVQKAKSKYNQATNTLTLIFSVRQSNEDGLPVDKTLTVTINKGAQSEKQLVTATLK